MFGKKKKHSSAQDENIGPADPQSTEINPGPTDQQDDEPRQSTDLPIPLIIAIMALGLAAFVLGGTMLGLY
ncbi:hypothetical protein [Arthrobacter castelli]|uniref:hypothetical protein n=1 Tax=Arthrobacter castelli TaxID=271431 RepID=UPI0004050097|nr:hypothetical protein [Arthrobacter castelli]